VATAPTRGGVHPPMRRDDQIPVLLPAETLGLALTAVPDVQLIEQVRTLARAKTHHPGHIHPPVAAAAHRDRRAGPARRPGASFRRPQALTPLAFEADEGTQVARRLFTPGHTPSLPT